MRIAIIDLGTNTFNLLVAELNQNNQYNIILNTKEAVKLGEGGINRKIITEGAIIRGVAAVEWHMERIKSLNVDKVVAFATSAIRDAENGQEFTSLLRTKFGLEIQVITGDKEAELIYLGVKQTITFRDKRFLILDIGGGSNEFIIADDNGILWKQSFPLGMARLLEMFSPSDPISGTEIENIEKYLDERMPELFDAVKDYNPMVFIGASGSFDSFVAMMNAEGLIPDVNKNIFNEIPLNAYHKLHHALITSTRKEREMWKGLEPVRRDMIVLASVLVNFVLRKTGLEVIYQSTYSLKEGAVWEIFNELKTRRS